MVLNIGGELTNQTKSRVRHIVSQNVANDPCGKELIALATVDFGVIDEEVFRR